MKSMNLNMHGDYKKEIFFFFGDQLQKKKVKRNRATLLPKIETRQNSRSESHS